MSPSATRTPHYEESIYQGTQGQFVLPLSFQQRANNSLRVSNAPWVNYPFSFELSRSQLGNTGSSVNEFLSSGGLRFTGMGNQGSTLCNVLVDTTNPQEVRITNYPNAPSAFTGMGFEVVVTNREAIAALHRYIAQVGAVAPILCYQRISAGEGAGNRAGTGNRMGSGNSGGQRRSTTGRKRATTTGRRTANAGSGNAGNVGNAGGQQRRRLSAAGRRRIKEAQQRRWERKREEQAATAGQAM